MNARVLTDLDELAPVEEEWRSLAVRSGNAFLTPEWYRAWFETAGADQTPVAVVASRDGEGLAGVLPLAASHEGRPRSLRFAGATYGDRFGIVAAEGEELEVAGAAMAALDAEGGLPGMLVLHRVDSDSEWPARMAQESRRRIALVEQGTAELPHVAVEPGGWETYLEGRSQKFRQRVARGIDRALEREGIEKGLRQTADAAALDADMATLFHLHDLRHPGAESSIADPRVREFLTRFAGLALERGWLRLQILELDRQSAAAMLSWRLGPSFSTYQSGFDPAWAKQNAGMLMLKEAVQSAVEEGAEDVDLLLGGEAFKWRFAPDPRRVHTVVLVGAARPTRALVSAEATARRLGRGLADRPVIGRLARSISRALPSGR